MLNKFFFITILANTALSWFSPDISYTPEPEPQIIIPPTTTPCTTTVPGIPNTLIIIPPTTTPCETVTATTPTVTPTITLPPTITITFTPTFTPTLTPTITPTITITRVIIPPTPTCGCPTETVNPLPTLPPPQPAPFTATTVPGICGRFTSRANRLRCIRRLCARLTANNRGRCVRILARRLGITPPGLLFRRQVETEEFDTELSGSEETHDVVEEYLSGLSQAEFDAFLSEFEATGGGVEGGGETAEGFEGSAESAVEDTGEDEFSADGGVIINSGEEEFSETESFSDEGLDEGEVSADGGVIINSSEEETGLFRRGFSFPRPTPIPLPPVSEPLSVTGTSEGFPDTTNTPSTPIRELLESDFLRGNFRRLFCRLVGLAGFPGNGQQHRYAFCNTNIIGAIPSFDNMVSTISVLSRKVS